MSKYHELKSKLTISSEEEKEYKKCSVTKIIEAYYNKGEKIPQLVLKNINFTSGVFSDYYLRTLDTQFAVNEKETIAQNIMNTLPLSMYEEYMDTTWLKLFDHENQPLITRLINQGKFDVVNKFLELVSKEDKKDDFTREVFEPIFNMSHILYNIYADYNSKNDKNKSIKEYVQLFNKGIDCFNPFFKEMYKQYKVEPKNLKKWHKEYESIYVINKGSKLHDINLYLLKDDNFLDFIKDIFNQYDNPKENMLLQKQYFVEAIKNGQEKVVTYYIFQLLKNNIMTQEDIEDTIAKSFHEKVDEMKNEIIDSFKIDYKNEYKQTYNLNKIYDIAIKYGNYQPNYAMLSNLVLIDNPEFQENFVQKILPENKIILNALSLEQWKYTSKVVEEIKELTGKGFVQSQKQREKKYPNKNKEFVENNAYDFIYVINQINKSYSQKATLVSDYDRDKVYEFIREEVIAKLVNKNFDMDKLILNHKLNERFEEKEKNKAPKI